MNQYLAIDIGGTEIKYGILNESGKIVETDKFSSQNINGSFVLEKVKEIAFSKSNKIEGIAISAPGFINADTGYIENGGSYRDFDNFNMKLYLENELSIPVTIENDVNCVAYAEKWLGNAREDTDFACIAIGTGIGGALFLNNRLYRGVHNRAGEFGYMINQVESKNIINNTLNQTATMLTIRKRFSAIKNTPLNGVSGESLFEAFDNKEQDAINIVSNFYESIAKMIYNLYYFINPKKLLIGGGISNRPSFIAELKSQLSKYGINSDLLEINTCYFKNHAGMVGATYHHLLKRESLTV